MFADVATTALRAGIRKFRAKPSATSTWSPAEPTFSTRSKRTTFISALPPPYYLTWRFTRQGDPKANAGEKRPRYRIVRPMTRGATAGAEETTTQRPGTLRTATVSAGGSRP